MTSAVDVVNQALGQIRQTIMVTSIDPSDGSPAGNWANLYYQSKIDALSRAAHWNCLRYQSGLTILKAAQGTPENPSGTTFPQPPQPWLYEYAYPNRPVCLKARFIVPLVNQANVTPPLTTASTILPPPIAPYYAVPFVVASDLDTLGNQVRVILSNACKPQLVYTARVESPDLWDPQFLDAAVAILAAWLCEPISGSDSLTPQKYAVAKELIMAARISDSNEGPTRNDHVPDWISIRGAGFGVYGALSYIAPWDQISFPGGGTF